MTDMVFANGSGLQYLAPRVQTRTSSEGSLTALRYSDYEISL
ncbi:MAG TPA: hypothetical protein VFZ22_17385 [Pyrinomonadaceae bacterium]|nr:hypothetical protein [Pyrinomonadaceae bacterium]